jgi:hypothetical protein
MKPENEEKLGQARRWRRTAAKFAGSYDERTAMALIEAAEALERAADEAESPGPTQMHTSLPKAP